MPTLADPQDFSRLLKQSFLTRASLDNEVLSRLKEPRSVEAIAPNLGFHDQIDIIVRQADSQGWVLDLVASAAGARPAVPGLRSLMAALAPAIAADAVDPFKRCCLIGAHVMVNRANLRQGLKNLAEPMGKRILIVRDADPPPPGTKTGKSHTTQLVAFLEQQTRRFESVVVRLETLQNLLPSDTLISPYDLADTIARRMGLKDVLPPAPADAANPAERTPGDKQWARWSLQFCENLKAGTADRQRPWWIVIDSFNSVKVRQETIDLILALANAINDGWPSIRLVLLGFPSDFAGSVDALVEKEEIRQVDLKELGDFFMEAYLQRAVPVTPDHVVGAVGRVVEAAPMGAPDFLVRLAPAIADELSRPPAPPGPRA